MNIWRSVSILTLVILLGDEGIAATAKSLKFDWPTTEQELNSRCESYNSTHKSKATCSFDKTSFSSTVTFRFAESMGFSVSEEVLDGTNIPGEMSRKAMIDLAGDGSSSSCLRGEASKYKKCRYADLGSIQKIIIGATQGASKMSLAGKTLFVTVGKNNSEGNWTMSEITRLFPSCKIACGD